MRTAQDISASHGFLVLLTVALLLGACQTESTVDEPAEPALPDNELVIEDPWIQSASAGDNTALYMTIANGRSSTDTLVNVRAPIIGNAELQEAMSDTGAAPTTQPLDSLVIPAEMRTVLEPGGRHVVLTNLSQSLSEDQSLVLDLVFSQSEGQRVRVPIRSPDSANDQ